MTAVQIVSVNLFLAGLLAVAVYVRNWIMLAIWLGLLLGGFLAVFLGSKWRKFAPFLFMGGATLFFASVIVGGKTLYTGYLGMVIAFANFWTYDRHRPPLPPFDLKTPLSRIRFSRPQRSDLSCLESPSS